MEGEGRFDQPPQMREAKETKHEIASEVLDQIEAEEDGLANEILEVTQVDLLRNGIRKVSKAAVELAFVAQLFAVGTASARETVKVIETSSPVAETNHDFPKMSEAAQAQLQRYVDEGAEIKVYPVAGTTEVAMSYVSITPGEIAEGYPFVFDFPISHISIRRPVQEINTAPEAYKDWDKVSISESDGPTSYVGLIDRANGTVIDCLREFDSESGEGHESIMIVPEAMDTVQHDREGHAAFNPDLSALGINLDGAFYHRPPESIGTVAGLPVMTGAENREQMANELNRVDKDITKGIKNVHEMFGISQNVVTSLVVTETADRNAHAYGTTLTFNDELLKRRSKSDDELRGVDIKMTGYMIEEVTEHEVLHVMDYVHDISSDEDLKTVWTMIKPEMRSVFDESHFSGTYGGHGSENVMEFFASVMNGLDDPRWVEHAATLSEVEVSAYLLTLRTIRAKLQKTVSIPIDAPVFDLLSDRIQKLEAMQ